MKLKGLSPRASMFVTGTAIAITAMSLFTACGSDGGLPGSSQQLRDLENVPPTEPEKVRLVVNVNDYPNIVLMCVEGVGFITTTRDGQSALQESPGLTAKWCAQ